MRKKDKKNFQILKNQQKNRKIKLRKKISKNRKLFQKNL